MQQILGIIAPHPPIMVEKVGGARSSVTARSTEALENAAALLARYDPDVVVVVSPHSPLARDTFLVRISGQAAGDLASFGAPGTRYAPPDDPEFARAILMQATARNIPAGDIADITADPGPIDHGVIVPMSFLDPSSRWPFVGISPSFLPLETHHAFGCVIRDAADALGRKVAFIASGDLSHRLTPDAPAGYSPHGAEFDEAIRSAVSSGDFPALRDLDTGLVSEAGECGLRSFVMLGGFLEGSDVRTRVLHYEGPWGVGYLTAIAASPGLFDASVMPDAGSKEGTPGEEESPPVSLARRAIESYVRRRVIIEPPGGGDPVLSRPAAAFVSLHDGNGLRGCIGTMEPSRASLAEEVVSMAIQAATQDPRFPALTADELDGLEISVDVLEPPEPVSSPGDLDPEVYGVIVTKDWRRGVLLPDLEGVDTVAQQLDIARRKAGIDTDESVVLERFRVERFR